MPRLKYLLLALTVCAVPSLCDRVFAQSDPESDVEALQRELMGYVERRLDQQRSEMMREMEKVIRDALQARRGEGRARRQVEELEEQIQELRAEIRRLRGRLEGARAEVAPVVEREAEEREEREEVAERPFLGIASQDIDEETARAMGVESGLIVDDVIARSPAALASLRKGDVIVQLDGRPASAEHLLEVLSDKRIGDPIAIEFVRRNDTGRLQMQSRATLGNTADYQEAIREYMERAEAEAGEAEQEDEDHDRDDEHEDDEDDEDQDGHPDEEDGDKSHASDNRVRLGVRVAQDNFELQVRHVEQGSNAAEAGLQPGDSIVRVAGRLVRSLQGLEDVLTRLSPGKETVIQYRRGNTTHDARVRLAAGSHRAKLISLEVTRVHDGAVSKRAFLGIGVELSGDGLRVSSVVAESAAARMGLKVGDILLSVNGSRTASKSSLSLVLGAMIVGQEVSVVVNRAGRELVLRGPLDVWPEALSPDRTERSGQSGSPAVPERDDTDADNPVAEAPAEPEALLVDARATDTESAIDTESVIERADDAMPGLGIVAVEQGQSVLVDELLPGSAAGAAGIRRGDTIVSIDGETVEGFDALERALARAGVGDEFEIAYARNGSTGRSIVRLAAIRPEIVRDLNLSPPAGKPYLGLELERRQQGFLVTQIHSGSPADRAGLEVGDQILTSDGRLPGDFDGLRAWLQARAPGDQVQLEVRRGVEVISLPIVIGAQ